MIAASTEGAALPADQREQIVNAVTDDLRAAADAAAILEKRLRLKLQAQVRTFLTEAASRAKD